MFIVFVWQKKLHHCQKMMKVVVAAVSECQKMMKGELVATVSECQKMMKGEVVPAVSECEKTMKGVVEMLLHFLKMLLHL